MNDFMQAFSGFFRFGSMLAFFLGVLTTLVWTRTWAAIADRRDPDNKPHGFTMRPLTLLWTLVFLMIGYIGAQQQAQKIETENCEARFQEAILNRDKLQNEAEDFAKDERKALAGWLTAMVLPPPDIAALHTTDAGFQEYAVAKTNDFYNEVNRIEALRQNSLSERAHHPLPSPRCQ